MSLLELSGRKFNRLTVVRRAERIGGQTAWVCICQCGNEKTVRTTTITRGITKSCGCLRIEKARDRPVVDLTGRCFGMLVVIGRGVSRKTFNDGRKKKGRVRNYWICRCKCGKEKSLSAETLMQGSSKSCGCKRIIRTTEMRGNKHPSWMGGHLDRQGYIKIKDGTKSRGQHILVMESLIGRRLYPKETVHHKNGVRSDNRPENLELWASSHCSGQRVRDLIKHAVFILSRYNPRLLKYANPIQ